MARRRRSTRRRSTGRSTFRRRAPARRRSFAGRRTGGRRASFRRSSGSRTVRIVIEQPGAASLGRVVPGLIGGTMVNAGGSPKASKF